MERAGAPVEIWERRHGASCAPLSNYVRREPEKTLLHAVVRERLEPFLAAARERSPTGRGLPAHVERDLRAYLDCGILARGFARVRCPDCAFERLVAFSCKARSCPSCNARRVEDTADHLVHDVFPKVPVRQWVLSFPRRPIPRGAGPRVATRLLDLFTRTLFAWQRRRARRLGAAEPRTGGCTAVQRFGGSGSRTRSGTPGGPPTSTGSRSTPGSGSARTTARGWSASSATPSGRPSPCTGFRGGRRAGSSTG